MAISSDRGNQVFSIGYFPDVLGELEMDIEEIYIEPEPEPELEVDDEPFRNRGEAYRTYTARQRIEIAREGKWLESVLSDFDAYYEIEDFDDYYAVKFSH